MVLPGVVASGVQAHGASAVRFDALADFYNSTAAVSTISTTAVTMAAWVYAPAAPTAGLHGCVCIDRGGPDQYFILGLSTATAGPQLLDNGGSLNLGGGWTTPFAAWFYLAVTYSSGAAKIYGGRAADPTLLVASAASGHTGPTTTSSIRIGQDFAAEWFNGRVAGVKIWSGAALSAAELELERFAYSPVRTSNLFAWYSFDNGPDTVDKSGNGRTLTANGTLTTEAGPPYTS